MLDRVKQVLLGSKLHLLKISCSAVAPLKNGVAVCSSKLITSMKEGSNRCFSWSMEELELYKNQVLQP